MEILTKSGPHAPNGITVIEIAQDGIVVEIQPDSGLDITSISGAKRQFLERATGPTDSLHLRALAGTLRDSLQALPAWPSTTLPGYDPLTGLHQGLSGMAPIDDSVTFNDNYHDRCQTVSAMYDLAGATITGNTFSQPVVIAREISLPVPGASGIVSLVRTDRIEATRGCNVAHLEHPNTVILSGDRVMVNLDAVARVDGKLCLFDRDGVTPDSLNIFRGLKPEAFEGPMAERCFFAYLTSAEGMPAMMLVDEMGESGIGVVHVPETEGAGSFFMIWVSPMGPALGRGVGSIEVATALPLGISRCDKLGLLTELKAEEILARKTVMYFLEDRGQVQWFAKHYGITTNVQSYPETIGPDTDGDPEEYNQETATFDTLRRAAGIKI